MERWTVSRNLSRSVGRRTRVAFAATVVLLAVVGCSRSDGLVLTRGPSTTDAVNARAGSDGRVGSGDPSPSVDGTQGSGDITSGAAGVEGDATLDGVPLSIDDLTALGFSESEAQCIGGEVDLAAFDPNDPTDQQQLYDAYAACTGVTAGDFESGDFGSADFGSGDFGSADSGSADSGSVDPGAPDPGARRDDAVADQSDELDDFVSEGDDVAGVDLIDPRTFRARGTVATWCAAVDDAGGTLEHPLGDRTRYSEESGAIDAAFENEFIYLNELEPAVPPEIAGDYVEAVNATRLMQALMLSSGYDIEVASRANFDELDSRMNQAWQSMTQFTNNNC